MPKKKAKTLGKLKKETQKIFNQWVRLRDEDQPCIVCGKMNKPHQCGHFFSVSTHDSLRFDPDNAHSECPGDNLFNQSHLIAYRDNLLIRIGQERFDALYKRAADYKQNGYRFTRSELEEIKKKYK